MRMLAVPVLLLAATMAPAGAQTDCDAIRCAVQATIDQQCPCDAAATHGRYVACVAEVIVCQCVLCQ